MADDLSYIIEPLREHAVPVDEVSIDPANANTHPERNMQAITDSMREFGQRQVLVARKDNNTIIAGNGRLEAARALGWSHVAVAFVDDDEITALRYAIADNRSAEFSEWDGEVLSKVLQTIENDYGSLDATGFNQDDLDELLDEFGGGGDGEELYTSKIEAPIYEITGKKPKLSELYDDSKTRELLAHIEEADVPEDVAEFLRLAAHRHTRFTFSNIAEFYAHADEELQELMEESALVIIDFDAAIEGGFVQMTERLAELVGEVER